VSINTRSLTALVFLVVFFSAISAWASPNISSISPTVGPVSPVGSSLTINGSGFGASASGNTVTIGGISTTPTSWSDTKIVAPVPGALLPGFADVIVTSGNIASNAASFLVIPVLLNDSPSSGPVNTSVVVTGTSFGDIQGESTVTFNGVTASPTAWSNTSITAPVPPGATTGGVVVIINGFSTNGATFRVFPNITAIGPALGMVGSLVTLSGTTFGQTQGFGGITFNGVSADVQSWSDSSITALVPAGATSGNVIVTDHQLLASNGMNFDVVTQPAPVISVVSPNAGRQGISVTISGSNFGAVQNGGSITFNGLPAAITSWSDTSISTSVPVGVHSGPVVVTNSGGGSNGVQFTFAPGIRSQVQALYITPDEINLEVEGSGSFKLVDASGHPVTDATWSVDSTDLATIAADDSTLPTATLQALAAGEITITATSSLGTAQAKATIFGAGLMAEGTPAWGFYPETQDNFFDFKAKSRRNTDTDPFLYVPEDTFDFSHLSALDENGRLAWKTTLNPLDPGNTFNFLVGAAGTNDGGVLVMAVEAGGPNDPSTAMVRYAPDGTPLWNHKFATSGTSLPAIAQDGTVFVLTDTTDLIALNDTDGTEKFRFSPVGGSRSYTSSEQPGPINADGSAVSASNPWKPCADFFAPDQFNPPSPGPGSSVSFQPLIGTDGSAYLMDAVENLSFNYDHCTISKVGTDPVTNNPIYIITSMSGQLQYSRSAQLLRVSSGGSAATQVGSVAYSGQAGFGPGPFNTISWSFNSGASQMPTINFGGMVPTADGGILMSWGGQLSSTPGSSPQGELSKILHDGLVATFPSNSGGDDMATNDQDTVFSDASGNTVQAVDMLTGTLKWTVPGELIAATDDGGVLVLLNFQVRYVDANGSMSPDALPVPGKASMVSFGIFQATGPAGSVALIPTNSNILSQLIAGPWPIPKLGTPASAQQAINVNLREVRQQGIVPNNVQESAGCTGFDPRQAPRIDLGALMAPVQTTETFTDANGNPVTRQTPANNVVSMKNNSQHSLTLVPHIPAFNTQPEDTTVRVTISPQTLPADGQYHDITFTGVAASDVNRPVRIEAFDNATAENRGDILQVDVRPWHRWFIDYYAVSELNGRLQPTPPAQATLQAELDRIFVPQANLGFTLTNKGPVADDYDVSPNDSRLHVPIFIDPTTGARSTCDLGFTSLGAINPTCTDDTELTPMYQRLITAQRQASQNQVIDLDNQDMFYLLYFKNFDKDGVGGFSDPSLDSFRRRLPSVVHTDYASFPNTLNQDRFNAITSAHEIAHKLGRDGHYDPTEANAVYLMVKTFSIVPSVVKARSDDKNYPCRLGRKDWNKVNYVYPTPR
jgi:hypothetical protein